MNIYDITISHLGKPIGVVRVGAINALAACELLETGAKKQKLALKENGRIQAVYWCGLEMTARKVD